MHDKYLYLHYQCIENRKLRARVRINCPCDNSFHPTPLWNKM